MASRIRQDKFVEKLSADLLKELWKQNGKWGAGIERPDLWAEDCVRMARLLWSEIQKQKGAK